MRNSGNRKLFAEKAGYWREEREKRKLEEGLLSSEEKADRLLLKKYPLWKHRENALSEEKRRRCLPIPAIFWSGQAIQPISSWRRKRWRRLAFASSSAEESRRRRLKASRSLAIRRSGCRSNLLRSCEETEEEEKWLFALCLLPDSWHLSSLKKRGSDISSIPTSVPVWSGWRLLREEKLFCLVKRRLWEKWEAISASLYSVYLLEAAADESLCMREILCLEMCQPEESYLKSCEGWESHWNCSLFTQRSAENASQKVLRRNSAEEKRRENCRAALKTLRAASRRRRRTLFRGAKKALCCGAAARRSGCEMPSSIYYTFSSTEQKKKRKLPKTP